QLGSELQIVRAMRHSKRFTNIEASRCLELGLRRGPSDALQCPGRKVNDGNAATDRRVRQSILQANEITGAAGSEVGRELKVVAERITHAGVRYHIRSDDPRHSYRDLPRFQVRRAKRIVK